MSVEKEEERIRAMLDEAITDSSDESSSEQETDYCSEHEVDSGTEQEGDDPVEATSSSPVRTENESDDDPDYNLPLSLLRQRVSASRNVRGPFYTSKDGTKWYENSQRTNVRFRSENIVTERAQVKDIAKNASTAYECWEIFVTLDMLSEILVHTNAEIRQRQARAADNVKASSYIQETNLGELKAFIGLLYLAGLTKSNRQSLKDLWRTDGTGVDIFRTTMSLQRFQFLQNNVRFDDKSTRQERKKTDNMAAIRNIFDQFVQRCQTAYSPSEFLTIDEMLLSFRGRCLIRVYIPNKPAKYGLKILALVDAKNFYVLNLEVYAGKQPPGPYAVSNKPFDVVERLIQPVSGSHRNVTFDNWFTGYELMLHLLKEHRLTSVGTVRKNKRQIPESFTRTGKQPNSSIFGFQKDITLVSYAPNKNKVVLVMSTMHHDNAIDESTGDKRKPEIITFYNSTKAGVDVVDELSTSYNVSRNSKRWPMTLFYGVLNMAAVNALIIYRVNNNTAIKRTEFIRNLGLSMIYEHLQHRKQKKNIPRYIRQKIEKQLGEPSVYEANAPGRYVRCQDCPNKKDRKTKHFCTACAKPICMEHAKFICENCADLEGSD